MSNQNSSWAAWVKKAHYSNKDFGDSLKKTSAIWKQISSYIALYRDLTSVNVGGGDTISFWHDTWLTKGTLSSLFPALFSHALRLNISVRDCVNNGLWEIPLRYLTSARATCDLTLMLNGCHLSPDTSDLRIWRLDHSQPFSVRGVYQLTNFGGILDNASMAVWQSFAPKKCNFFAWLMIKGRIKVRTTLHLQGVIDSDACPFECGNSESVRHLATSCPRAIHIWQFLGLPFQAGCDVHDIFTSVKDLIPSAWLHVWDTVAVTILWNFWLGRNRKVFDNIRYTVPMVVQQCRDTLKLWTVRMTKMEKQAAQLLIESWQD